MNKDYQFAVGDFVRILPNAKEIDSPGIAFVDEMEKYCGGIYKVWKIDNIRRAYKLEDVKADSEFINGDGHWLWDDIWLDHATPIKEISIKEDEIMAMFE